jgi:large subunit ribosomal protein L6
MGRFGKLPVELPEGVSGSLDGNALTLEGVKGSLTRLFPRLVKVILKDGRVVVEQKVNSKTARAAQGTTRAHIANMAHGVAEGWKKQLEIGGPGYRAEVNGKDLALTVGYSHPVVIVAPKSVNFVVEKSTITVEGIDKEEVGQVSAKIRDARRPNPYTGSGIKYTDEVIRRKVGKTAGKTE